MTRTRTAYTNGSKISGDPYFDWLCRKVEMGGTKQYFMMASALHQMAFRPGSRIEADRNRANDGLQLRVDFMEQYGAVGSALNRGFCSMLEFLIGLAKRMSFVMACDDVDEKTAAFFWKLIRNLRLLKLDDERYNELNGDFYIQEAVDRVLLRQYGADGDGGLFPLREDHGDQRDVEIWYQMQYWLGEHCEIEVE